MEHAEPKTELETVCGTVENIIYKNETNGYTVCDINCDGVPVTVVGILPFLNEGETVSVTGEWTYHSSFGKQFKAEHYEKQLPTSKETILSYLASGAVSGIGPVLAHRIVDKYGEDSLDVLENHPDWLADINGITMKKAMKMNESYREQFGMRNVMMFFNGYFGPATAVKVYKRWGAAAVDVVKSNPYLLCEEINGIGFERADKLAAGLGIDPNSPFRLSSGIKYALSLELSRNGNCYLPLDVLTEKSCTLLGADREKISDAIAALTVKTQLIAVKFGNETAIYLDYVYESERYCADKLYELSKAAINIPIEKTEYYISDVEKDTGFTFAEKQRDAIKRAVTDGLLVLTGGPGTGKTTVIKAILTLFDVLEIDTALAAPTGRAAKRMSLATGREAKTIHRLLEADYGGDNRMHFQKDENSPLDAGAVIIDEISMADVMLLSALLKAIKPGTKVILIGDSDQLPPVGAGDCLRDILSSGAFSFVKLDTIFRQASSSLIVENAHMINSGKMPILSAKDKDFFFMPRSNAADTASVCMELCEKRLPKAYGYDPLTDIQVISPTRKGEGGTATLNKLLQSVLNPPAQGKAERTVRDMVFRVGDKVMQIRNDYMQQWKDKRGFAGEGVYNGDIGVITDISIRDESFTVTFDDKISQYDFSQIDEIEHAFAVTVHKSQGSEYPCVIIPLSDAPYGLLTRNMLYTAVTRAQQMVIIVGKEETISLMVSNNRQAKRNTGLCRMLKAFIKTEQ
ncbi:MAG: ATP-dependent RecD-like DNA helicase [Clostridia bacterium]|nr:ATP-dependent RecD-like DNA helicase [Clostridia bacterium]